MSLSLYWWAHLAHPLSLDLLVAYSTPLTLSDGGPPKPSDHGHLYTLNCRGTVQLRTPLSLFYISCTCVSLALYGPPHSLRLPTYSYSLQPLLFAVADGVPATNGVQAAVPTGKWPVD
jgi:hypothetical protein